MILRGQIPKDQVLIEAEIKRVAKRNNKTKRKEDKLESNSQPLFLFPLIFFQEESNMAEEQTPPPRRTLGDYVMYWGPRHFSSIAIPTTTRALEIKPAFLSLISTHQFTTMDHENPYTYLSTFYELVGTMGFQ